MLPIIHIDNVTRVLTRGLTPSLPSDLLTSLPDLLVVDADPQPGGLGDVALQVEEIMEQRVLENTHLTSKTS